MKKYKVCQSCGMPLSKDELGGGTESNGSKSIKYCSHCYMDGKFVQDITAIQMQQFVQEHLIKNIKTPKFLAKFLVRNIPKLDRWK
ncbi:MULTISPECIES: zinc ribbon domain-containing protein [Bacillus]|uniref:Putative zinc ribbon domain-containing protein n=1 Tax=Bacillus wiedmannii TaxID=1890302 RepID=A0AB37Z290_9BACI|nr:MULTISPECIES: zinc ribbon domain-containing protein [Bacillus]MBZ4222203.1 zinc ribbon domain-containing protein [Bacillus wiedmannii]MCU5578461.1 zinc ribbon domain-containing protein [Bacillus wiedmannii]MDR4943317.1 zinc ribbon domain-containing protein [Bacillus wiedmannii]MED3315858.1 zinc ribbon domain-containing protein [Bacillus wiedmannii]MEE3949876.1 zinc ribbon domain-containing protein [Bacillus wiedmannii]